MGKLFLSCKEAIQICNKSQYSESTNWERFKLKIHTVCCGICKQQSLKNKKLTETLKKSNIVYLDAQTKTILKANLQQRMDIENH